MLVVLPAYYLEFALSGNMCIVSQQGGVSQDFEKDMFIDSKYRNLHFLLKVEAIIGRNDGSNELWEDLLCAYVALSKAKYAIFTAHKVMKVLAWSAKALKRVDDVHAVSFSWREKGQL